MLLLVKSGGYKTICKISMFFLKDTEMHEVTTGQSYQILTSVYLQVCFLCFPLTISKNNSTRGLNFLDEDKR